MHTVVATPPDHGTPALYWAFGHFRQHGPGPRFPWALHRPNRRIEPAPGHGLWAAHPVPQDRHWGPSRWGKQVGRGHLRGRRDLQPADAQHLLRQLPQPRRQGTEHPRAQGEARLEHGQAVLFGIFQGILCGL